MIPPRRAARSSSPLVRGLLLPLALAAAGQLAAQQPAPASAPVVVVRDVGPRVAGRILRGVLAAPHQTVLPPGADTARLERGASVPASLVVVGHTAVVAGEVHGDLVVVGGDLVVHPGAVIDGRAIAIGGGVYLSSLATIRGGPLAFRDETFVALPTASADTVVLAYRSIGSEVEGPINFPAYGLRLPSYDRVEGLSVPFGPTVRLDSGRVQIDPTVTYRSHLGEVDAAVRAQVGLGRRGAAELFAGRGTRSNESWNRSDLVNSFTTLGVGADARNYYRADVFEARVERRWETENGELAPFVGALTERAWSVGPDSLTAGAPFSFFRRRDRDEGMLRVNPGVAAGRISSAIGGAAARWGSQGVVSSLGASVEVPFQTVEDARFVQATLDGSVGFPTFGTQRLDVYSHAVLTAGDTAPPQRFAYLGGDGTIVTRDLLELGGDQLLYVEGLYSIPLERWRIPWVGVPTLTLRYAAGSAGTRRLPALDQNVGVGVSLSYLRLYYAVDPATRESRSGVSLSVFR